MSSSSIWRTLQFNFCPNSLFLFSPKVKDIHSAHLFKRVCVVVWWWSEATLFRQRNPINVRKCEIETFSRKTKSVTPMPEHTLWALLVKGEKNYWWSRPPLFDRRRPNPQVQEKLLRKAAQKRLRAASIMAKRQIENWAKGLPRNPSSLWQANCEGPIISLDLGGSCHSLCSSY